MYITAQGPRLRNDLYCVEWDVKLYYTMPYHSCNESVTISRDINKAGSFKAKAKSLKAKAKARDQG